jgi:aldose 1-epimerase
VKNTGVAKKVIFKKNFINPPLEQISIKNDSLSLRVLDYGAVIQDLRFLNGDKTVPLVAGFANPADYLNDNCCLGACVGRFAGRISGRFTLEGEVYPLHTVAKGVHLHGGKEGFWKKYWAIGEITSGAEPAIALTYVSPHMEEGYPGELRAEVKYSLKGNSLVISHRATTDRPTFVNLVNHSYFLFDNSDSIEEYRMHLNCNTYLETKPNLLPTGKIVPVVDTPYDFRNERKIGTTHLDTPFLIASSGTEVASLFAPGSGIRMGVTTNQPAVVVYTPREFAGICFETQNLPDAPNISHFPSSLLQPGMVYDNTTTFTFERPGKH